MKKLLAAVHNGPDMDKSQQKECKCVVVTPVGGTVISGRKAEEKQLLYDQCQQTHSFCACEVTGFSSSCPVQA